MTGKHNDVKGQSMVKKVAGLMVLATTLLQAEGWSDRVTLNGYFSFEFEERVAGKAHKRADEYGSFDADLFDLVINVQATDRLRLAADLTWEHGPQTESENERGNVATEYAFAEYTLNDYLKIRAGKMFTAFGIYNEIHTAKPSTIIVKEPDATNKMYFMTDYFIDGEGNRDYTETTTFFPRWGSGVALLGDAHVGSMPFDYILQVTNGDADYGNNELNQYDHDDNDEKAVGGRVRLDLTGDLQIGASFYTDTLNKYADNTSDEPIGKKKLDSQGAQMIWHVTDDLRLELEYVTGTLNVDGGMTLSRSGYSILPSYYVSDNVNLYFLYTAGDPNHDRDEDRVVKYAPGVNIEMDDNMFLKMDLYHVDSEEQNYLFEGEGYTEFRIALAIGF